jgi:hypothetical protein
MIASFFSDALPNIVGLILGAVVTCVLLRKTETVLCREEKPPTPAPKCKTCGTGLRDSARFCSRCGCSISGVRAFPKWEGRWNLERDAAMPASMRVVVNEHGASQVFTFNDLHKQS